MIEWDRASVKRRRNLPGNLYTGGRRRDTSVLIVVVVPVLATIIHSAPLRGGQLSKNKHIHQCILNLLNWMSVLPWNSLCYNAKTITYMDKIMALGFASPPFRSFFSLTQYLISFKTKIFCSGHIDMITAAGSSRAVSISTYIYMYI